VHAVGETHDTPSKLLDRVPLGSGTVWVDQACRSSAAPALGGCWGFPRSQKTNDVSRFAIGNDGRLTRLGNVPTSGPPADPALSNDSRYLFVLDVLNANGSGGALIDAYRVESDGGLVHLSTTDPGIPDSASGLAAK
jgi:hypothetical protein